VFSDKPRIVAANKIDALDDPERLASLERHLATRGVPVYRISAATGEGLPALLEAMWADVSRTRATPDTARTDPSLTRD
jgi:GTP-binding protein